MSFSSVNPANNMIVWTGSEATVQQIQQAVEKAEAASEEWSSQSLEKRIEFLKKYEQQLRIQQKELAEIISKETGKPFWESLTEVNAMIGKIDISIHAQQLRSGEIIQTIPGASSITRHKPHGIVAVFGPYNFPGHLPNGHIVPALLAGNAVLFKPSELTPGVAAKMAEIFQNADFPAFVFQVLQGGKTVGQTLTNHPKIKGVFFTGSSATGKILLNSLKEHPEKILALEMGGNNPYVIDEITDFKAAAYLTVQSCFLTSGQRCTCARRIIVKKDIFQPYVEELIKLIKKIKVGSYTENPEPFMGPVISHQAALKLVSQFQQLSEMGGKPLIELKHLQENTGFLSPGLIDVTSISNLPDEEYFGPFTQVIQAESFDHAIRIANQTSYGLAAGILTDNAENYQKFYRKIQAGIVNWNMPLTGASSNAPFGGIGHSGNHRPSAFYATDYCCYPVASLEKIKISLPEKFSPGIEQ